MKSLKKVLAILIVAMLALASVSALADTTGILTDGDASAAPAVTDSATLQIFKSVVVENPVANITVAHPTMTFNYEIAPATVDADATVTDAHEVTAAVKAGVPNGVTITNSNGNVVIAAGTVDLNKNGQEIVSGALNVSVDLSKFDNPGIYRYAITDKTADADLAKFGVVRSTELKKVYYLDVYIKWIEGTPGSEGVDPVPGRPAVAGYVLTHENHEKISTGTDKDSGFDDVTIITTEEVPGDPGDPGQPGSDPTDPTYSRKLDDSKTADLKGNDFYYTYNATLKKTVTGSYGDKKNEFKFDLAVTNTINNEALDYYVDGVTTKGAPAVEKAVNAIEAYAKDGDTVTIFGLNPYATVKYTETNNTQSVYTYTKVTDKAGTELNKVENVAANATVVSEKDNKALAVIKEFKAAAQAEVADAAEITYENNLDAISPTGLVLRFAPYLAMLAAGLVIVMLARRKKTED